MRQDRAVDEFRLVYERTGPEAGAPTVLLLHGWPGDRTDYREVVPLVSGTADVVVPDLRGFGESDKHEADPASQYTAAAQARSLIGLIEELGLGQPVLAGYDIGSRIAQAIARDRPDLVRALVIAPPLPGIGDRILQPQAQQEFWYQAFHQLELCTQLIDGRPEAVRSYLRYFWSHWSGPGYEPAADHLDHLVSVYGSPGAFAASIAWYRAGAGSVAASLAEQVPEHKVAVPTTVLWPEHDPLFPRAWSDRIGEFFAAATLTGLDGAGHFSPLEAPAAFAAAITAAIGVAVGRVEVPADLAAALARDAVAWARFEGMPDSHRREWVRWVTEAKKADTRATRISKTVQSLRRARPGARTAARRRPWLP